MKSPESLPSSGGWCWPPVSPEMVALALEIPDPTVLVRLPKSTRLPTPHLFRWRLAKLAQELAYPGRYPINRPAGRGVGKYRHFILREDQGLAQFLAGVVAALQTLGVLAHAEVFVTDRETGIMRRLAVSRQHQVILDRSRRN